MQHTYEWLEGRVEAALLSPFDKKRIEELAREYGVSLNKRCPNCYRDAVVVILTRLRKMKKKQRYILQRGIAFRYKGVIYTAQNATDEAVRWWLKQDINNGRYVTELPEWVEGKTADAPVEDTEIKNNDKN